MAITVFLADKKTEWRKTRREKASLLGSLIQKTVSDSMLENGSFVVFARYKQIAEIFNLFFPHLNVIGNQHGLFQQFQIQGIVFGSFKVNQYFLVMFLMLFFIKFGLPFGVEGFV